MEISHKKQTQMDHDRRIRWSQYRGYHGQCHAPERWQKRNNTAVVLASDHTVGVLWRRVLLVIPYVYDDEAWTEILGNGDDDLPGR